MLRDHCLAPERVDAPFAEGGRYGRMFDFLTVDEQLLHRTGAAGGFCDGGDCKDVSQVEAGWPFFDQYVAHDLTADRSPLRAHADLDSLRNMRTPRANLESLYSGGPLGSPYMYTKADPAKLLEHEGDLPRNELRGAALAHLALPMGDRQRLPPRAGRVAAGAGAARLRRRFYRPNSYPFIPVEFADAAYRYGHSQLRQLYQLQPGGPRRPVFPDLIGLCEIGDRHVDWSMLFDVPGRPEAQRAKPIDGLLPRSLIELPQAITGAVPDEAYRSLAMRDLERGEGTGLPSGEAVAELIGAPVLGDHQLDLRRHGWEGQTPLWLYILRESAAHQDGNSLGPVGGRIVGEVMVEIIARNPESYLAVDPDWSPTLPAHAERFRLRASWCRHRGR